MKSLTSKIRPIKSLSVPCKMSFPLLFNFYTSFFIISCILLISLCNYSSSSYSSKVCKNVLILLHKKLNQDYSTSYKIYFQAEEFEGQKIVVAYSLIHVLPFLLAQRLKIYNHWEISLFSQQAYCTISYRLQASDFCYFET